MARDEIFAMWNYDVIDINRRKTFFFSCSKRTLINNLPNHLAEILFNFDALMRNFREAFLYYVPSISRTLLFSDKAWVYKRHFVLDCNDCSMAWSAACRGKRCTSHSFDSRRGFACDTCATIGFVKIIEYSKNVGSAGVRYIT